MITSAARELGTTAAIFEQLTDHLEEAEDSPASRPPMSLRHLLNPAEESSTAQTHRVITGSDVPSILMRDGSLDIWVMLSSRVRTGFKSKVCFSQFGLLPLTSAHTQHPSIK